MAKTIYEDIQALRARIKKEMGLKVKIEVYVYTHENQSLPGFPTRQAVDFATWGGVPVYPEDYSTYGTRWWKLNDWENGVGIILFR